MPHWQSLQLNSKPDTSIQGAQVAENTRQAHLGTARPRRLRAPDIDILRQATATLTSEQVCTLFEPRNILAAATRSCRWTTSPPRTPTW